MPAPSIPVQPGHPFPLGATVQRGGVNFSVYADGAEGVDLLLFAAPDDALPQHVRQAMSLARRLSAWIVQANWPNSLNYPELSPRTGRSAVIAPDGEIAFRLPQATPGVATFALGDRDFQWAGWDTWTA